VLPYIQFCNCLLDYGYVLHIVNFTILYLTNPIGNTNQKVSVNGPMNVSEMGSGTSEE
jgi:hypothetical protein